MELIPSGAEWTIELTEDGITEGEPKEEIFEGEIREHIRRFERRHGMTDGSDP